MSELQLVTRDTSGWCDPETGVCHLDITGEPTTAETDVVQNVNPATDATGRQSSAR